MESVQNIPPIRENILKLVRKYYKKNAKVPSVRTICKRTRIYNNMLYQIFPGKLAEICQKANIPCPTDRIKAMSGVSPKKNESDEYETFITKLKELESEGKKGNLTACAHYTDLILDYVNEEPKKRIERFISLYKVSRKQCIKDAFSHAQSYPDLKKMYFVQGKIAPKFMAYIVDVLLQWTEKCSSIYGPVITRNYCVTHGKQFIIAKDRNKCYLCCCDKQGCLEEHIIACQNCNEPMKFEVETDTLNCDSCKFSMKYEPELPLMIWGFERGYSDVIKKWIGDAVSKLVDIRTGQVLFTFKKKYWYENKILTQELHESKELIEREDQSLFREFLRGNKKPGETHLGLLKRICA